MEISDEVWVQVFSNNVSATAIRAAEGRGMATDDANHVGLMTWISWKHSDTAGSTRDPALERRDA